MARYGTNGRRLDLNPNAYTDNGTPKYLRIYDDDGHYTVVFTRTNDGTCHYLSIGPGESQHGEHHNPIDRPSYRHLGRKSTYGDLPEPVKNQVLWDYQAWWGVHPRHQIAGPTTTEVRW